ncbi:c6 transcription [Lentinula edodes]|uniref:C6 transcription n=1 Tax=Lentinula edodes TaxID=5353 RepID=A0A1Q3DZU0_LENED|nr:c6 transcription [Lentinula edodes]
MDDHGGTLMMESMDGSGASTNGPVSKRRRKNDGEPSEPRRLRRSHEACTRCRGKKIKCDSKHPRYSSSSQPAPAMNPAPPPPPPGYFAHPPPPGVGYYQYPPYMYPAPPPFQLSPLSASPAPLYHYHPPAVVYNSSITPLPSSSTATARLAEEDLAVGSSGLDSGRDRVVQLEMPAPRDTAKWRVVSVFRSQHFSSTPSMDIWIPNDRNTLLEIVDVYFTQLNPHRPVFFRHQFLESLNQLYDEGASSRPVFDPGFICSLYLVLALGTLSELNRSGYQGEAPVGDSAADHDSKICYNYFRDRRFTPPG